MERSRRKPQRHPRQKSGPAVTVGDIVKCDHGTPRTPAPGPVLAQSCPVLRRIQSVVPSSSQAFGHKHLEMRRIVARTGRNDRRVLQDRSRREQGITCG
jgi:hypothetical protein